MFNKLIETRNNLSLLVIRIALAVVIFPHGAQKALGWFGGDGITQTLNNFESGMNIPQFLGALVIFSEFIGSVLLAIGFLGRIMAFLIMCVMLGAVYKVHIPNGFFMDWQGKLAGEGYEFHILAVGMCISLIIGGSGIFSVDKRLEKKKTVYF